MDRSNKADVFKCSFFCFLSCFFMYIYACICFRRLSGVIFIWDSMLLGYSPWWLQKKQNKGLLTISGHQHRFKYEHSSNKSKGPCTQRLRFSHSLSYKCAKHWNLAHRVWCVLIHLLRNNSENNTQWSLQAVRMTSFLKREKERGNIGCIRSWDGVERTELRDIPGDSKFTSRCQWLSLMIC